MKTKKFAAAVLTMALAAMTSMPAFAGKFVGNEQNNFVSDAYRYVNDDGTYLTNGWFWLDRDGDGASECYYFDQNGWTLSDKTTPDGYQVNTIGAWIENGVTMKKGAATVDLSNPASFVGTYTDEYGYTITVTDNGDGRIMVTCPDYSSTYHYDGNYYYRGYEHLWMTDSDDEKVEGLIVAGVGQLDDGFFVRVG